MDETMTQDATTSPSQSTLSASFGPYVQDMLSRGWGLSQLQYQPYTGQRTAFETTDPKTGQARAGYSPLEQQAFAGFGGMGQYQPGQFNTGLGAVGSVQDYMNPYMSGVTDIASREARRQADIGRQAEQARFVNPGGAGAFGGSRQAIMESERQRNLGTQLEDINTKGLQAAFDRAQQQRLNEATLGLESQRFGEQSRQFGAGQDLRGLESQLKAGQTQRGIEQAPLDFGYQQFQESMKYPYQQLGFMQSLLSGQPLAAPGAEQGTSTLGSIAQGGIAGLGLYNMLFGGK